MNVTHLVVVVGQHFLSLLTRHGGSQLFDLVIIVDEETGAALFHRVFNPILNTCVRLVEHFLYQEPMPSGRQKHKSLVIYMNYVPMETI